MRGKTVERIKNIIPNVLALNTKANYLPDVCSGFGLEDGEECEAYSSKYNYVLSRIKNLSNDALIEVGKQVLEHFPNYNLEEAVNLSMEEKHSKFSELTRRKILDFLKDLINLEGRLNILEFFGRVFPLEEYLANTVFPGSLADEIKKHMILNDDWNYECLFKRLLLLECSEYRFVRFLELLLHPIVRYGEEQKELAEKINRILHVDGYQFSPVEVISGEPVFKIIALRENVAGIPKNLIFAADGPKPDIIIRDAINNDLDIVKNSQYCLVYNRNIPPNGLKWGDLVEWWALKTTHSSLKDRNIEELLYKRLWASLASKPEKVLFRRYYEKYRPTLDWRLPALVPQVYLHYDPYTAKLRADFKIARQRMDFLILFSNHERVVIEVDGKQHYAEGNTASPKLYANMTSADRSLRLTGYEVYRFGAWDLIDNKRAIKTTDEFFDQLFQKYGVA